MNWPPLGHQPEAESPVGRGCRASPASLLTTGKTKAIQHCCKPILYVNTHAGPKEQHNSHECSWRVLFYQQCISKAYCTSVASIMKLSVLYSFIKVTHWQNPNVLLFYNATPVFFSARLHKQGQLGEGLPRCSRVSEGSK